MSQSITPTPRARSLGARWREDLSTRDRRSLLGMAAVVLALHVIGFGVLLGILAPAAERSAPGTEPGAGGAIGVGVGLLAYLFGLRHAFDADHISAIDNTTRALAARRAAAIARDPRSLPPRPLSVGFWFSLGHSSVVVLLAVLLALGVKAVAGQVSDDGSALHRFTGVWGPSVSGIFLWGIGLANLLVLLQLVRAARRARALRGDDAQLEALLERRGRLRGVLDRVGSARRMYPVGFLFGLGFDTATEVGLLGLAAGAAAVGTPILVILVLPVLFAAGMSLMDAVDGVLMYAAYGWALARPVRRLGYNLVITGLSVATAALIGTVQLAGALTEGLGLTRGPIAAIAALPLESAGFVMVGLFVLTWLLAVLIWRVGRIEERWAEGSAAP